MSSVKPIEDSIKTMGGNYITDPSSLTTQQLWREIASLKELLMSRINSVEKAIEVAHEDLVRVPTDVQKSVITLKELHDEKFAGINQRFLDNKLALDAAFKSVQDGNQKSELGTTKQIDAQGLLINNATTGLQGQINDLKERVLRGEALIGGKETGSDRVRLQTGQIIAYIFGAIGVLSVLLSIYNALKK